MELKIEIIRNRDEAWRMGRRWRCLEPSRKCSRCVKEGPKPFDLLSVPSNELAQNELGAAASRHLALRILRKMNHVIRKLRRHLAQTLVQFRLNRRARPTS
jgi:hypothetical protein